ncbi:hypothetical protein B0H13DRAFT_1871832 [Mycena leptocephala]|nr:hypothetical protein B0H13DRAFT_1871832 [Mycena leptocephala]
MLMQTLNERPSVEFNHLRFEQLFVCGGVLPTGLLSVDHDWCNTERAVEIHVGWGALYKSVADDTSVRNYTSEQVSRCSEDNNSTEICDVGLMAVDKTLQFFWQAGLSKKCETGGTWRELELYEVYPLTARPKTNPSLSRLRLADKQECFALIAASDLQNHKTGLFPLPLGKGFRAPYFNCLLISRDPPGSSANDLPHNGAFLQTGLLGSLGMSVTIGGLIRLPVCCVEADGQNRVVEARSV